MPISYTYSIFNIKQDFCHVRRFYQMQHSVQMTVKHITQIWFSFSANFLSLPNGSENFDLMKVVKQTLFTLICQPEGPQSKYRNWTQEFQYLFCIIKILEPWREFFEFWLLEIQTMFTYKIPVSMTLYTGREPACTHTAPIVCSRQPPSGLAFIN